MQECKHETQIAVIGDKVENIEGLVEKIFKILNGNGKDGVITQVALNKSAITRLWWFFFNNPIFGINYVSFTSMTYQVIIEYYSEYGGRYCKSQESSPPSPYSRNRGSNNRCNEKACVPTD